jgi:hypothetical protein
MRPACPFAFTRGAKLSLRDRKVPRSVRRAHAGRIFAAQRQKRAAESRDTLCLTRFGNLGARRATRSAATAPEKPRWRPPPRNDERPLGPNDSPYETAGAAPGADVTLAARGSGRNPEAIALGSSRNAEATARGSGRTPRQPIAEAAGTPEQTARGSHRTPELPLTEATKRQRDRTRRALVGSPAPWKRSQPSA